MEIRFLGNQTTFVKGKKEGFLVNPENMELSSKFSSRIAMFTSKKFDIAGLDNEKVIIRGPGEYEIGGVEINGMNGGNGDSVYTVVVDGVAIGFFGALTEQLSDKKQEKLPNLDVMVVSVKKNEKIGDKWILELAKKLGVNYLIPVGYSEENEDLKRFLDSADQEGLSPLDTLKIDKENLPDGLEVVVLKS